MSVIFPAPCRICDEILENASTVPICPACLDSFKRIGEPHCKICGGLARGLAAAPDGVEFLCPLCRDETFAFQFARSFGVYDKPMHEAIMLLKYNELIPLGRWFAARLAEIVEGNSEQFPADVIVPVPLHKSRERERGYNQAELIARPLAKKLRLPCEPKLLMRNRPRPGRLLLARRERWDSVRGAFTTPEAMAKRVKDRRVLVVDDIFTTGATMDACARALLKAGAARVTALSVARVVESRE